MRAYSFWAILIFSVFLLPAGPALAGDTKPVGEEDRRRGDAMADEILGRARPDPSGLLAQRFRRAEDDFGDEGYDEGDFGDENLDEYQEDDLGGYDDFENIDDIDDLNRSGEDTEDDFDQGIWSNRRPKQSPFRLLGGMVINYGRNENTDLGFGLQGYAQWNFHPTFFVEGGLGYHNIGVRAEENTLAELDAQIAGYTNTIASGGDSCTIIPLTIGIFGQGFFDGGRMYYGLGLGYYMADYSMSMAATSGTTPVTITQDAQTGMGHFLSVGLEYDWKPNLNLVAEARLKVIRPDLTTSGDTLGTFGNRRNSLFMDSFDYTFGVAYHW